jgi:flagellum-specific peptidoglycan hydrolase FlgJ
MQQHIKFLALAIVLALISLLWWHSTRETRHASIQDTPSEQTRDSIASLPTQSLGRTVSSQMIRGFARSSRSFHKNTTSVFQQIARGFRNATKSRKTLRGEHAQQLQQRTNANQQVLESWSRERVTADLRSAGTYTPRTERTLDYIEAYLPLAIDIYLDYGIPVSFTLTQGILESGSGTSKLATIANNHFGMKCGCPGGNGSYYANDDDYVNGRKVPSCFNKYRTVTENYRQHAILLTNKRYGWIWGTFADFRITYQAHPDWLKRTSVTYYQAIAIGVKASGYATDPVYHVSLIRTLENFQLWRLDAVHEYIQTNKFLSHINNQYDETVQSTAHYRPRLARSNNILVSRIARRQQVSGRVSDRYACNARRVFS